MSLDGAALAQRATATELAGMPSAVVHSARRIVIDTIGCILAGLQEPDVRELVDVLRDASGNTTASVLGSPVALEPMWAASVHATAGAWHEFDSGSRFLADGHPACQVVPAAMAAGQHHQASGAEFLRAVIAGFEAAASIGRRTQLRPGMDSRGTWPNIGAAVAVGMLAGMEEPALAQAVNMAASLTLATSDRSAREGATIRNLYAGYGAGIGVMCSDLAEAQFTGGSGAIESVFGGLTGVALRDGDDQWWEIGRTYLKPHACARAIHPALDAFARILDQHAIEPEAIEQVTVWSADAGVAMCDPAPDNELAARFSVPFALAVYGVHGRAGVAEFSWFDDPRVRSLAQRIVVAEDPQRAAGAAGENGADVAVHLASGESVRDEVALPVGEFDHLPLSDDDLSLKFLALSADAIGADAAQAMLQRLWQIDREPSMSASLFG